MNRRRTTREHLENAAVHHTTLCLFQAISDLVSSSDIDSMSFHACEQIRRLCKKEAQRHLRQYDKAIAAVSRHAATPGRTNSHGESA